MSEHQHVEDGTLRAEVIRMCGLDAARCYQCAKCSAGCPMAEEMGLRTHEIIRLVQIDAGDRLLADPSMFLCVGCETCSERCPNEVHPARLIDALRELSAQTGRIAAPRRIQALHESFLDQIKSHGRVFEFGLVASYKLRSGDLFSDVLSAPGMLFKGKLPLSPRRIKGVDDVRRIFRACKDEEGRREP